MFPKWVYTYDFCVKWRHKFHSLHTNDSLCKFGAKIFACGFFKIWYKKNSIFNFIKKSRKLWARYLVFFNVRLKIYSKSEYHYYLVIGDRFIASSIFIDWYTVWPHLPIMIINSIMSLKILHYLSMHFRCILFKQRGEKLSLLLAQSIY